MYLTKLFFSAQFDCLGLNRVIYKLCKRLAILFIGGPANYFNNSKIYDLFKVIQPVLHKCIIKAFFSYLKSSARGDNAFTAAADFAEFLCEFFGGFFCLHMSMLSEGFTHPNCLWLVDKITKS